MADNTASNEDQNKLTGEREKNEPRSLAFDSARDTETGRLNISTPQMPRRQYMVGRRGLSNAVPPLNSFMPMGNNLGGGLAPFSLDNLVTNINNGNLPGVELKKTVEHASNSTDLNPMAFMGGGGQVEKNQIVVLDMEERHAAQISQHPDSVVEIDHDLRYQSPAAMAPWMVGQAQNAQANRFLIEQMLLERRQALYRSMYAPSSAVAPNQVAVVVTTDDGTPNPGAEVILFGSGGSAAAKASTDESGVAVLDLQGTPLSEIVGAYIKPAYDFWERYVPRPQFDANHAINVVVRPLSSTFPDFPTKGVTGWGIREMGLHNLPGSYDGSGVRVAIIDSGAATTHVDLSDRVREGYDLVNKSDSSWQEDLISHGSHCAGVITGLSEEHIGIQGIATGAEVMAMKIFPGGSFSDLIGALNRCMEKQVDIVNLSLGSDQPSQLVEQAIVQAKNQGIACVVAAGNSGGAVQYPAKSPNTLAVSAIGKFGTFPQDSFHAMQVMTELGAVPTEEGLFAARFSCFGPEIDVCAPGVAILSSVPPNNYASWDGTSMAAPHVTGLAALILAHHPQLNTGMRTCNRVDNLFNLIKSSAKPLALGSPYHTGAGLPDAKSALGIM